MGHSKAEKSQSRERILSEASRQIRAEGLESVSIPSLMKKAGLTHGGFYGHFRSRAELQLEALKQALREGGGSIPPKTFRERVQRYLSEGHRNRRANGCAIPALISDVARADDASKAVMRAHVERIADQLSGSLGGDPSRAKIALSAMVGALAIARAFEDEGEANEWLQAVRQHLFELEQTTPQKA